MKISKITLPVCLAAILVSMAGSPLQAKQYAIIKADDFIVQPEMPSKAVSEPYLKFIALVKEKKVVAGLGLIVKTLERVTPEFVALCRELEASGRFEIWNHGYDHAYEFTDEHGKFAAAEFYKMPFGYQQQQMNHAQDVARQKLGLTMRSFGAPGNWSDATTSAVIARNKDLHVWFYVPRDVPVPDNVVAIPRTNLEWNSAKGSHYADADRFIKEYDPTKPVICFQLHPRSKSDAELAEVARAIDFLLSKGVEFIKPYDYYLLMKGSQPAATSADNKPAKPAAP